MFSSSSSTDQLQHHSPDLTSNIYRTGSKNLCSYLSASQLVGYCPYYCPPTAASPSHWPSPSSPCWRLGLHPSAAAPSSQALPPLHSSQPPPSLHSPGLQSFGGSEPITHSQAPRGSASFRGGRVAGGQGFALSLDTTVLQPSLTWLWSCFHGDSAGYIVFSIYI